ncbi:MAG: hypothetical protein J0L93_03560 [Deltaproteobacteria bacterium]|nr:hypothetical protein [Deltaproteobacteria bacterium]
MLDLALFLTVISSTPPSKVEIVRPETYAVKRFGEIVSNFQDRDELSPQEELISSRARLMIAQRKLSELQSPPRKTDGKSDVKIDKGEMREVRMKAARAEIDHYQHLVSRLEQKILKVKRHERKPKSKPTQVKSIPKKPASKNAAR